MKKVMVSTTQRCGSTWLARICGEVQREPIAQYVAGLKYNLLTSEEMSSEQLRIALTGFSSDIRSINSRLFKSHDLPPKIVPGFLDLNPDFFVFNITRDFRDVLISRLFYNRYFLPDCGRPYESEYVATNQFCSDHDLVNGFLWTREMDDWLHSWKQFNYGVSHPRYRLFRYEELLMPAGLARAFATIASDLGIVLDGEIEAIQERVKFENVEFNFHRNRTAREVKSDFCRKGVAGDYKVYLSEESSKKLCGLMGDDFYR